MPWLKQAVCFKGHQNLETLSGFQRPSLSIPWFLTAWFTNSEKCKYNWLFLGNIGRYLELHLLSSLREFPPLVVRSGFIKLKCQTSKKDKSHVIKKYPALLPVSDLNILVFTDTNWRRKLQVHWESTKQPLWNHQSAAVVHLFIGFMSAIHPVFRSVIFFPFGKFPENSTEKASTDGEKKYICSSVGGIFAHW